MATTGSGTSAPAQPTGGSYTLAQLVSRWRSALDDTVEEYLWSNDELTSYADKLQKELVAELPILEDRTDDTICNVAIVQGNGLIDLSMQRIITIKKAWIDGQAEPLHVYTSAQMDANYGDWQGVEVAVTQATPTILVLPGMGVDKAYLYPPLDEATGTLKLLVYRLPLLDLDYDIHSSEYLEIDKYAHLLIHGIMWQAYLKNDADTFDQKRAEQQRVYWEGADGKGGDREQIRRMVYRRFNRPEYNVPDYGAM